MSSGLIARPDNDESDSTVVLCIPRLEEPDDDLIDGSTSLPSPFLLGRTAAVQNVGAREPRNDESWSTARPTAPMSPPA